MPRVFTKTLRASKRTRTCSGCGKPVLAGQEVYTWKRRMSRGGIVYYRHVGCGYPRPTQLSSRKTAQIDEAVADNPVEWEWSLPDDQEPVDTIDLDADQLTSPLEAIADVADGVADEYEDSKSNMPDALQYSPTAEAMQDVADRLHDWASQLRDLDVVTTIDLPDPGDYDDPDDWRNDAQGVVDDHLQQYVSEAQDLLGEQPDYEG